MIRASGSVLPSSVSSEARGGGFFLGHEVARAVLPGMVPGPRLLPDSCPVQVEGALVSREGNGPDAIWRRSPCRACRLPG